MRAKMGLEGHRLKTQGLALPQRPLPGLAQVEEPHVRSGEVGGGGRLGSMIDGKNRIMIFGPKDDGTYVVEFRTAQGERSRSRSREGPGSGMASLMFPGAHLDNDPLRRASKAI